MAAGRDGKVAIDVVVDWVKQSNVTGFDYILKGRKGNEDRLASSNHPYIRNRFNWQFRMWQVES